MTARCPHGVWVTRAPDTLCAEPPHVALGGGEYEPLTCDWPHHGEEMDDDAWMAWADAWEAWRRSLPHCPPGRDEGRRP